MIIEKEKEILQKVKSCIEKVGEEWRKNSDDYFWSEADLQHKLQSYLWKCPEMYREYNLGKNIGNEAKGKSKKVPLVHAEFPTKSNKRPKHYDLAVLRPEDAEKIVTVDFAFSDWLKRIREKRQVLAAIEVERTDYVSGNQSQFRQEVEKVIIKLMKKDNEVIASYILITCAARRDDMEAEVQRELCDFNKINQIRKWVEQKWEDLCRGKANLSIYWVSDHPQDEAIWFRE